MKNKTLALILVTGIGLTGCKYENINLEIGQVTKSYLLGSLNSLDLKKENVIIRYNWPNVDTGKVLSVTIINVKDSITLDSPEFLREAQKEYDSILSQIEGRGIKYLK
ncbi:MAG: hypothetical protein AABX99_03815 [Nanoarchaeota archaeon]